MSDNLTQKTRLIAILIYIATLLLLSGLVTGYWLPPTGGEGLWFYSAVGLLFYTRLSTPFFRRPRDSFAIGGVAAAFVLATVDLSAVQTFRAVLNVFRWVGFALAVVTTLIAAAAIWLYDPRGRDAGARPGWSKVTYNVSDRLGRGQVVFTVPALISILGFYQAHPAQELWLLFIWALLVFAEPVELLLGIVGDVRAVRDTQPPPRTVGQIQRIDDPGIIRVNLMSPDVWKRGNVHVASLPDGRQVEVLPLNVQTQDAGLIGTGLCHREPAAPLSDAIRGHVYRTPSARNVDEILAELCGNEQAAELIGFVVEDSSISTIRFEVASDIPLQEGMVVFVRQQDETVYYQVLDARTVEESFWQNPRGTHVVTAGQLGLLRREKGFEKHGWVPAMNAPVFCPQTLATSERQQQGEGDGFLLGFVPQSNMRVLASFKDMLEHHTAILGVTGTGKTELAFDIIAHALRCGAKVFCVDFTGEYEARLADCSPEMLGLDSPEATELSEKLFAVDTGEYGAKQEKKDLQKFVDQIRPEIQRGVDQFLSREGPALAIFSLPEIANTKATLRATELYLSTIFHWARKNRRWRRILVVLEEAHTIIPESSWSGFDSDTQWIVGRIGQIALQGRKYGVGLLLVSQRTALVSKTLLSQCNTCISFAMYDKTGLDYLANVFSPEHVRAIPNLKFLHAIAFGKAVHSDRPVLFEIPEDPSKREASEALRKHGPDKAENGPVVPPTTPESPRTAAVPDDIAF